MEYAVVAIVPFKPPVSGAPDVGLTKSLACPVKLTQALFFKSATFAGVFTLIDVKLPTTCES